MPNTYFQFKKFTVQQDKAAMKVCTDSCLFGAWIANEISKQAHLTNILDIGAGTGLLSLILAQKTGNTTIEAIETDAPSAQQATDNFALSEWKERLTLFECRIQNFTPGKKYDFIISNPPFYEDDLLSNNDSKNKAHHSTSLSLRELMISIKALLSDEGSFAVLLPYRRAKEFELLANEMYYFVNKKVLVKQTEQSSFFRAMLLFSKENKPIQQDEIFIKDKQNQYSQAFTFLLKDYYLYL